METCKLAVSAVSGAILNTGGNTFEETKICRDLRESLLRKIANVTLVVQFFALPYMLSGCGKKNKGEEPTYATVETIGDALGAYYYKIGAGDNLTNIAKEFGITIDEILYNNPQIKNESLIMVGDVLYLPIVLNEPDENSKLNGSISRDGVNFKSLVPVVTEPRETEPEQTESIVTEPTETESEEIENIVVDDVVKDWEEKLSTYGYVKGIDVSNAGQSGMDLDTVLKLNPEIDFVMVRAGYFVYRGASVGLDKKFLEFAQACHDNNKPMGIYYWPSFFNKEEAQREAKLILDALNGLKEEYGLKLEMPIGLDIELPIDGGGTVIERILKKDPDTLEAIETTINTLSESGYYVSIYIGHNALTTYPELIDFVKSLDLDTWIPKYDNTNPTSIGSTPKVPNVCYDGFVGIRQYSRTGVLKGYNGDVDLDVAFVNYPKIMREKLLGGFEEDGTLTFHN